MSQSSLDLKRYIRDIADFPKPGIMFRDITPLLGDPEALRETVRRMADPFRDKKINAVVAAEARGFIFGAARGILIIVVAVQFFNEWVPPANHPAWIAGSKSKPFLDDLGEKLKNALPEDVAALLRKKIEEKLNDGKENATPPAETSTDTAPADSNTATDTAPAEEDTTTPQQ